MEGFEIGIDDGLAFPFEKGSDGRFKQRRIKAEERGGGTEQDDVHGTRVAEIGGDFVGINDFRAFDGFDGGDDFFDFGIVVDVDDRFRVGDDDSRGGERIKMAESFHRFDGDDQIGRAWSNQIGIDLAG